MREEIEARPAVVLFTGLIFGLIAFAFPPTTIGILGLAAWIRPLKARCILGCSFLVGLFLSPPPVEPVRESFHVNGIGTVVSVPTIYPGAQVCEFQLQDQLLFLTVPMDRKVALGDRLGVDGEVGPLRSTGLVRTYQPAQGKIRLDEFTVLSRGSWVAQLADEWRRSFMAFLESRLSHRAAMLTDAICFNARNLLDSETRDELAASGTIRVLSAAGLQVFVIASMIGMAMRFVPTHRWVTILMLATALTVYSFAAGLQPQIVRASVMAILGLAAYLVKREPDALSAFAVSGIGYLLWRPSSIYEMSFQISMVTVAALALFFRPVGPSEKDSKRILIRVSIDYLMLTTVIVMATTPLIAYYLGVVSTVSVCANLLLCWVAPALVVCGFVSYFISLALPEFGGGICSASLEPLCQAFYRLLDWVGHGEGSIAIPGFSPYWLVAFYLAWLMTYRRQIVQP